MALVDFVPLMEPSALAISLTTPTLRRPALCGFTHLRLLRCFFKQEILQYLRRMTSLIFGKQSPQSETFSSNIIYNLTDNGLFTANVSSNILSRSSQPEDLWIDLEPSRCRGNDPCATTIFGFNNASARGHATFKNARGAKRRGSHRSVGRHFLCSNPNNAVVSNEITRNNGSVLFDVSRSGFT